MASNIGFYPNGTPKQVTVGQRGSGEHGAE